MQVIYVDKGDDLNQKLSLGSTRLLIRALSHPNLHLNLKMGITVGMPTLSIVFVAIFGLEKGGQQDLCNRP